METKANKLGRRLGVLLTVIVLMAGLLVIPESAGAATKKNTAKPTITVTRAMQYPPNHIAKGKKCHLGGTVKASSNSYIYQIRARITNRVTGKTAIVKDWRPKGNRKPISVNIANTINPLVKFATLPAGHYTIDMYVFARNKTSKKTASKRVMHKGFTVDG